MGIALLAAIPQQTTFHIHPVIDQVKTEWESGLMAISGLPNSPAINSTLPPSLIR
jgi:hypothetical protein